MISSITLSLMLKRPLASRQEETRHKLRIDPDKSKTYKRCMVWARPVYLYRKLTFSSSLVILLLGLLPGCSAQPQTHPLDTKSVTPDAQFLTECSIQGVMPCKIMYAMSGDTGAETRS